MYPCILPVLTKSAINRVPDNGSDRKRSQSLCVGAASGGRVPTSGGVRSIKRYVSQACNTLILGMT